MKKTLFFTCFAFAWFAKNSFSQNVGIGTVTPNISAQVDITSTNKGLLVPRMTTSNIGLISSPAKGLMVYDSVTNQLMVNMGTSLSPSWQTITYKSGWNLTGNTGTTPANNFIGTTDNFAISFRQNNKWIGRLDAVAGNYYLGGGSGETATGVGNTNIGDSTGYSSGAGNYGIRIGYKAGKNNTGSWTTIIGTDAGQVNTVAG
ncbi:MAG: hypothetical protein JNN00_10920, partial [Chitinophagaceae bacterium]|nr:hypothetical protein [Chitinophagaceae bacterium]